MAWVVPALLAWTACAPSIVWAAPEGKAWIPVQTMQAPGFDFLIAPRMELGMNGSPRLFVGAVRGGFLPNDALGYDWADSAWVEAWRLNFDPIFLWPVDAPPGRYPLLFVGGELGVTAHNLYWSEVIDNQPTTPESIATTSRPYMLNYGGAMRGSRRWAAIQDLFNNNGYLRLFLSDSPSVWDELPVTEYTSDGMALLALDDTTALVTWSRNQHGNPGISWGTIRGRMWTPSQENVGTAYPVKPRLRAHPDGGAWLAWGTYESTAAIRRFQDGDWGEIERLDCNYTSNPFGVIIDDAEMSRDPAPRPVVVWSQQNYLDGGLNGLCVCFPDGEGWEMGEEIFRGGGVGLFPTVARDRNGDAWVVWTIRGQPLRWTHTYTTATAGAPEVTLETGRPQVSWKLSEPAPGSWWAVLRQVGLGEFEEVARVEAGEETTMSWIDTDYRPGTLLRDGAAYRIRRECVDARYQALSPAGAWFPGSRRLSLSVRGAAVGDGSLTLELSGTTGSRLEVTVYDVAGRVVRRHALALRGDGTYAMPGSFGADRLRAGVYFARARDESGAISPGVKFVRLR